MSNSMKTPRFKFRIVRDMRRWVSVERIWPDDIDDVAYPAALQHDGQGQILQEVSEDPTAEIGSLSPEVQRVLSEVAVPKSLLPPGVSKIGHEFWGLMSGPTEIVLCELADDKP